MSSIGPSLPAHLSKRTRDDDNDRSSSPESGEKRRRVAGPAAPPPPRVQGPARPPPSVHSDSDDDVGPAPPIASKPVRVLGPAPPPAPLSERPPNPPSDDESDSSEDDFGPAPPPAGAEYATYNSDDDKLTPSAFDVDPNVAEEAKKVQRDEWMTMPPTQDDLAARLDPTKLRARKFNSGKSARGGAVSGGADGMGVWTETPEQKLKRLQNEALGIAAPANSSTDAGKSERARREERQARRMKEKLEGTKGKSLVEQHQEKGTGKEKEDDPSKRGFDWEKDMNGGMKVSNKQRNDLMKNAKDFGGRFSGGSYL
ncbi:hypothetical protein B0J11DRAFT_331525 [Dendryphion nanum]|uniref:DUF3752 domain-containing protein n=1 Tax=Dendryphion nanum TaxID=256645 RepID=A0A9P9DNZ3_9PLEO|nr:hypothetical protein B0J11DRAFT_331525 [Dendryphion nanum]